MYFVFVMCTFIRFFIPYFCQFMMIYVQQEVRLLFELSETELDMAYKRNNPIKLQCIILLINGEALQPNGSIKNLTISLVNLLICLSVFYLSVSHSTFYSMTKLCLWA